MPPTLPTGQMYVVVDLVKELNKFKLDHALVLNSEPRSLVNVERPIHFKYRAAQIRAAELRERFNSFVDNPRVCKYETDFVRVEIARLLHEVIKRKREYLALLEKKNE